MPIGWRSAVVLMLAVQFSGCPGEKSVATPDAAPAPVLDAGVTEPLADAGPPAPRRLEFAVTARTDGGEAALTFSGAPMEIDPPLGFTLTTPVRLKDYRWRLFDWNDQVVPSDDTAELADAGLVYRIELLEPLEAGRRYSVVVDAEFASEISDEAGRTYDDVRLDLKVKGEPVAHRPPKTSKKASTHKKKHK
jgi:hypothetical protein